MRFARATAPMPLVLAGTLLMLQIGFVLALVLAAIVPDSAIVRNLVQQIEQAEQGRTWGLPDADGMGGWGTPTTDQAVLTSGLGMPELNPWDRALYMPRLDTGSVGREQVAQLGAGQTPDGDLRGYFRYWAGYTVLSRPVLALWGVSGLRIVIGTVLVLAAWGMARRLAARTSTRHVLALALPLLLGSNLVVLPAVSMSHALSFAVVAGGLWLLAATSRGSLRATLIATAVGAAVYNFVDLLTNPVVPWAMSAAVAAGLAYRRRRDVRALLRYGLAVGTLWPVAFGLTWVSRWVFALLTVGWGETMEDIAGQVRARTDLDAPNVVGGPGVATARNVSYWWDTIPTASTLLLVTAFILLVLLVQAWRSSRGSLLPFVLLCAPVVLVPIWYEVMSNHSQIHVSFTYRYVPLMLSLVLFAAVTVWDVARRQQPDEPGTARGPAERDSANA